MDILLITLGVIALLIGLIGSVAPMLPGPPISYVGLLLLHFTEKVEFTVTQLTVWFLVVVIIQVLDYIIPMLGTKYLGGSKWGNTGCIIGTILGLFFLPWGIIVGPFLGAVIGELIGGYTNTQALKSGLGSLLGFLCGTFIKLVVCVYFCVEFMLAFF